MSIKSAVRDGSFVKFLVGGVILLVLTGGGIYFVKKARSAETREDGSTGIAQVTSEADSGGAIVTIDDDKSESTTGSSSNHSNQPITSTSLPSDEVDAGTPSSGVLPRTGPVDAMPQVIILGSVVYGVSYFITNRRR